jgi:hypothetical protein
MWMSRRALPFDCDVLDVVATDSTYIVIDSEGDTVRYMKIDTLP